MYSISLTIIVRRKKLTSSRSRSRRCSTWSRCRQARTSSVAVRISLSRISWSNLRRCKDLSVVYAISRRVSAPEESVATVEVTTQVVMIQVPSGSSISCATNRRSAATSSPRVGTRKNLASTTSTRTCSILVLIS